MRRRRRVLSRKSCARSCAGALGTLPERERYILQRHFFDDVPMHAIGVELGVTESRISQIVTGAVGKLRQSSGSRCCRGKKSATRAARAAHGETHRPERRWRRERERTRATNLPALDLARGGGRRERGQPYAGLSYDVSAGGIFVATVDTPPIGTTSTSW